MRKEDSIYSLQELIIVKPVMIDSNDKWNFKDNNTGALFSATMEDLEFREECLNGKILKQTSAPDSIIAYVEYENELKNGEKTGHRRNKIIKVYHFNNQEREKIPSELKLNQQKNKNINDLQISLF